VLGFSDLQAEIRRRIGPLRRRRHVFNQRDIAGIFAMIRALGAMVGLPIRAEQLREKLDNRAGGDRATRGL